MTTAEYDWDDETPTWAVEEDSSTYEDGYSDGFSDGYGEGHSDGWVEGFVDGVTEMVERVRDWF